MVAGELEALASSPHAKATEEEVPGRAHEGPAVFRRGQGRVAADGVPEPSGLGDMDGEGGWLVGEAGHVI
jgi:hypothetical protein